MIALIAMKLTQLFPKLSERAAVFGLWIVTFLLLAGALYGAYCWAWDAGRDSERARWEAAAAKIEAADTKADAAATVKAAETKGEIDAANERAKNAARDSDDPLAAGIGELRKQSAGKGGQATR